MQMLGQEGAICLSTSSQTFICPQCTVLGNRSTRSSFTAALATTGDHCFMTPPLDFSGLQIDYGGRKGRYVETPPHIEELQYMLKLAKPGGLLLEVGMLKIGVIKMESTSHMTTEQNLLSSSGLTLALLFNDPRKAMPWGCWDISDFEDKAVILIESLDIADGLKDKIAHWLLPRIFFLEKAEGVDIILAQIPDSELEKIHVFRGAGFHRIGHSDFFGRARSKSHPSRVLPMEKDEVFKTQPVCIPKNHQQ
ncbi:hypothetical protein C8R47DRAFT_1100967 [Mycena vitilis]|nr:hypothetical protein C8R47DRAFT_1100967 [Mycena vitilis]